MKLTITKNQSKGMMGGVSFEVRAHVQLTPEEQKLVQYYKLENDVILSKKLVNIWGQPTDHNIEVRVKQLLNGEAYKCKDLGEVISYSESLKSACNTLKSYLEVAREFGGQEVYEI
jgi:hypothetical protein